MVNPLEIEFKTQTKIDLPEHISATDFTGLYEIQRPVFADDRGDFWEIARIPHLEQIIGEPIHIAQINRSRNNLKGTLRGIHIANWYKLIFIVRGSAFISLVDLRLHSPTYGNLYTNTIGDNQKTISILIPPGFGNAYQALADNTDYMYAVTDLWSPGSEVGVRWNDPDLAVPWPISTPILSPKDQANPTLLELIPNFHEKRK